MRLRTVKDSDYRIIGLVGEGQFGRVYGGIHRETGELVALKELNPQRFSTKKFLREIRILLSLEHPNIIRCLGVKHFGQKRYLVMEYCEGKTLRHLLENNHHHRLSIEQKLRIILDILDGLDYAHNEEIIHRDLKPENILLSVVSQGWKGKISDFGVAKIGREDSETNASIMGDTGSPAYMAPEQFYGKYSYSSDLYSVGVILYEMIVGDRPFSGNPNEIMLGHLNKTPFFPEDLPLFLKGILAKALQKLPQHRFTSASQMRETILQATLEIRDISSSFYDYIEEKTLDLKLINNHYFEQSIISLNVKDKEVYLVTRNEIFINSYQFNDKGNTIEFELRKKYKLEGEIFDVKTLKSGFLVVTREERNFRYYSLFHYDEGKRNLVNLSSNYFTYDVDDNCRWLGVTKSEEREQGFQLIDLKKQSPITPLARNFIPKQIISVDSSHGVVIYTQKEIEDNHTYFRFFNRRGNWYDTYTVFSSLENVVYHPQCKNTFLARERQTNNLVMVKFLPFFVTRIPLNFRADLCLPFADGFICANQWGNIAFLSDDGEYLGETNLGIFICAIAPLGDDKIMVLTEEREMQWGKIYEVNR